MSPGKADFSMVGFVVDNLVAAAGKEERTGWGKANGLEEGHKNSNDQVVETSIFEC